MCYSSHIWKDQIYVFFSEKEEKMFSFIYYCDQQDFVPNDLSVAKETDFPARFITYINVLK
jgi:hypothetical protein